MTTSTRDTRGTVRLDTLQLLLRGHPGELLPDERAFFTGQARYALDALGLGDEQRSRISAVWLEGRHAPAISETLPAQKAEEEG